jgi:hypothetical protein
VKRKRHEIVGLCLNVSLWPGVHLSWLCGRPSLDGFEFYRLMI